MIYSIDPDTGELVCTGTWPTDAREALEETRQKYLFLVEYLTDHPDAVVPCSTGSNCACCIAATESQSTSANCAICLIGLQGHRGCLDTPWEEYHLAADGNNTAYALEAAEDEVLFIEGVLRDTE